MKYVEDESENDNGRWNKVDMYKYGDSKKNEINGLIDG
jgi:hypothetical protein